MNALVDPIRLALPSKGHLHDGAVALLGSAGFRIRRASDRQYEASIRGQPRFHVVFMRPADIVAQVHEGRCHLGVTGMDVYGEHASEATATQIVVEDLGYGGCRLVVAVPESWIDVGHVIDLVDLTTEFKSAGKTFRVSTKYPALTRSHFRSRGIYYYQLINSDGALELHPSLGIADVIVDLTSSGATLKENRLKEIEGGTVLNSAACLIGHAPSIASLVAEGHSGPLALLLDAIDGVHASDGWLHLEVVGGSSPSSADAVARLLESSNARQIAHGEVRDARGEPGWRLTARVPADSFPRLKRPLFELGATRIVGLPTRFVFDAADPSSFDRLISGDRERAH